MLHLSASIAYYFFNEAVDMRKGFDSLSGLMQQHMQMNVTDGGIFIFMNKKGMSGPCSFCRVCGARKR